MVQMKKKDIHETNAPSLIDRKPVKLISSRSLWMLYKD